MRKNVVRVIQCALSRLKVSGSRLTSALKLPVCEAI